MTAINPYLPDVPIRDADGRQVAVLRRRSVAEHINALDWAMDQRENGKHFTSTKTGDWSGTDTVEEYRDMLRDGWPEGLDGVESLDGLCSDAFERAQFVRDVGGAFPIIPAAIAGAPDAMLNLRTLPSETVRAVTLVVDGSFNAGVRSKTALQYAQKVMQLIAWLQAERIDATVHIVVPVQMRDKRVVYCTTVRDSGTALQPERLAAMIHPAWLRRSWFAMCERDYYEHDIPECSVCTGGYGQAKHVKAEELRTALPDAQSVIVLPKVGDGNPLDAVQDALNVKLKRS